MRLIVCLRVFLFRILDFFFYILDLKKSLLLYEKVAAGTEDIVVILFT